MGAYLGVRNVAGRHVAGSRSFKSDHKAIPLSALKQSQSAS